MGPHDPKPDGSAGAAAVADPRGAGTALIVGCKQKPLILGTVADPENAVPQLAWMEQVGSFAVGWSSEGSFHIRYTSGHGISNSKDLPSMPGASPAPQLFWTGAQLELYYALADSIVVDLFDHALRGIATRTIGDGRFRAVQLGPDRVGVLTDSALFVDGMRIATTRSGGGALGWNGDSLLIASVLGHGEWWLHGLGLDGRTRPPTIELRWCGSCGSEPWWAGGTAFASSPSARRHALVVATDQKLKVAIEGKPVLERPLFSRGADASLLWDGERYLVLQADGTTAGESQSRDISLLAISPEGQLLMADQPLVPISQDPSDDRFAVAAAAGPGNIAIAWVRGNELAIQRCALTERTHTGR